MTTAAGLLVRRVRNVLSTTPAQRHRLRLAVRRLDDDRPDWYEHVNLRSLHMPSYVDCLLGQVYGEYDVGLVALYGRYVRGESLAPGITAFAAGFPRRLWAVEVLDRRRSRAGTTSRPPLVPPDDRLASLAADLSPVAARAVVLDDRYDRDDRPGASDDALRRAIHRAVTHRHVPSPALVAALAHLRDDERATEGSTS